MKKFLLLLLTVATFAIASAQTRTVTGVVVDAADNEPLAGASVLPIGAGNGTSTDVDGKFTLKVNSNVSKLKISYVGMHTMEVEITKEPMLIKMVSSDTHLDDVIVVAFGTTTKEAFTGSAAVVNADEIKNRTTTNIADALVGSVPGLQMRSTSGAPGSSQGSINIRGISSLYSGTQPLIIVDGAPYTASLSNIPQNDIESVSVLKDAASAALYGARGASGVIIITTKRGKGKDAEVYVNAKWGVNSRAVQDYDVITDPGDFYEAYYASVYNYYFYGKGYSANDAYLQANKKTLSDLVYNAYTVPAGETLIGTNGKLNPHAVLGNKYEFNGETRYLIPDNWTDAGYKKGFRQEYNLSVNGGTDRSNFYASMNYLSEEGILKPSKYDRVSGRIRADYQAKKWLKMGANVAYTHSLSTSNAGFSNSSLSAGNVNYFTGMIAPIYPLYVRGYDENGNPFIYTDENGQPMYDYGVQTYYSQSRPFSAPGNGIGTQATDISNSIGDQMNATLTANLKFTDYLRFDVVSNVTWGETRGTYYGSMYSPLNATVNGKLEKSNTTTIRTNNTQTLTFDKMFGDHYLNVMAGHEYFRSDQTYLYARGEGGFSPDILELDAFANRMFNSSSNKTRYNVEGWFGSAQYNYIQRYYVSASYRRDASSRFAKGHRWGNFWSVGGAWIFSKEKFMENTRSWLDNGKLKLSIGQQGNDNIGNYAWTDMYNLEIANPTTMSPVFNKGFGNPDVTWETTTNLNVGLEFNMFHNRLNGGIDFYNKKTTNLLFWVSVPETTGGRGYYGNIGDIRNTGVEFSITGVPVKTRDVEWVLSGNITHNVGKILKLPYAKLVKDKDPLTGEVIKNWGGFYESPYWYGVGGEMCNYMTLAFAGLNDQGQTLYYYDPNLIKDGVMSTNVPGTIKDKKYTTTNAGEASRYTVGCILPKAYGGFSTTLNVKGFDFNATFDYQIGGKIYDSRYANLMGPNTNLAGGAGGNYHKDWVKSWSPENPTSNIPRWQIGDTNGNQACDRYLTNASYLNFQSFTVGYSLPKFCKEISKLRVYVAGENLCFWSARKGLDPRYAYSGNTSIGAYSPMRTISGGLEVTF